MKHQLNTFIAYKTSKREVVEWQRHGRFHTLFKGT